MTRTHTSFEVSKRLKEFCPELPEPMDMMCYGHDGKLFKSVPPVILFPAYRLEDLLSKPFCEAFYKKIYPEATAINIADASWALWIGYYTGGLPAVESELMKMMEGK